MQPGSQPVMSELNTVDDVVGDERSSMPQTLNHLKAHSELSAGCAASMIAPVYGAFVTNPVSHRPYVEAAV